MIFKLLLIAIVSSCVFANTLTNTQGKEAILLSDIIMYEDVNASLDIHTLYRQKNLFHKQKKHNLGIKKHPIWTYATIQNATASLKHIIFSNPRAGIDFIDVYIFKQGSLVYQHTLGDMNPQSKRELLYRKSIFELELQAHQKYEILTRYNSFGAIDINWEIQEQKEYLNAITKELLLFGFVAGIVFLMSVLIIFIDRIFPSTTHKLYFFIISISALTQFSISGILYQYGTPPYLNTIISWSLATFGAALIGFFPIYFFDLKKIMPKSSTVLMILNYSLVVFSLLFLFYPLSPNILYLAQYSNYVLFLVSFLLIFISIRLYMQKIHGSLFYLLGNTSFALALIYFLFGLLGFTSINNIFYFSLGVGTAINIFFMAMAIGNKIFLMKRERENALFVMNEYSKLSVLGQSMINISHQWKEPINHIHYAINKIYAAKEFEDPKLPEIIDNSLDEIKSTTAFMANTGKNFLSYYKEEIKLEYVSLVKIVEFSKNMLKQELEKEAIKVKIKVNSECLMYTNKHMLSNVFIILFENTLKAFRSKNPDKRNITIELHEDSLNIYVSFLDNAGGIKVTPIESIFEQDLSDSHSTGIGLFLAKNILKLKLSGDISAVNKDEGVMFSISILKQNNPSTKETHAD